LRLSLFQSILTLTLIIKIWLADCHFELKLPNTFSAFHPAANTCQLKCLCRLLVAWQYSMQELVFGMIITNPEHWRLRLKWQDYHGIIAQRTRYKSHDAKCAWFLTSSCNGSIRLFYLSWGVNGGFWFIKHLSHSLTTLKSSWCIAMKNVLYYLIDTVVNCMCCLNYYIRLIKFPKIFISLKTHCYC